MDERADVSSTAVVKTDVTQPTTEGASLSAQISVIEPSPSSLARGTIRLFQELESVLQAMVLFVLLAIAIAAISETAGRQAFIALVADRMEALRQEIVDATINPIDDAASTGAQGTLADTSTATYSSTALAASPSTTTPSRRILTAAERLEDSRIELAHAQTAYRAAQSLVAVGAFSDAETLRSIRTRVSSPARLSTNERFSRGALVKGLTVIGLDVETVPSDYLLAVAVICCGAIGSFVATVRREALLRLRFLSVGMAAGFVVFLALKGGRHVFLVQTGAEISPLNPYSCAFAGLIAGLFTERAYLLLSALVDKLAKKIEQAIDSPTA